jgi:hypothetical protein
MRRGHQHLPVTDCNQLGAEKVGDQLGSTLLAGQLSDRLDAPYMCSYIDGRRGPRKRDVLRMLLQDYLRCSGGLAKQATGRKPVVCALCTHRPGGASATFTSGQPARNIGKGRGTPSYGTLPRSGGQRVPPNNATGAADRGSRPVRSIPAKRQLVQISEPFNGYNPVL